MRQMQPRTLASVLVCLVSLSVAFWQQAAAQTCGQYPQFFHPCQLNSSWVCWRDYYRTVPTGSPMPSRTPLPSRAVLVSDQSEPIATNTSGTTIFLSVANPLLRGRPYKVDVVAVLRSLNATGLWNLTSMDLAAGGAGRVWVTPFDSLGTMLRTDTTVATGPLSVSNMTKSTYSWFNAGNTVVSALRILAAETTSLRVALTFNGNSSAIPTPPTPTPTPTPTPISNQTDPDIDLRRWMGYDALTESPYPPPRSTLDWTVPRRAGYLANTRDVLDTFQRKFAYDSYGDNPKPSAVRYLYGSLTYDCAGQSIVGDRLRCWVLGFASIDLEWVYKNATWNTAFKYKEYVDGQRAVGREPVFPQYSNWSFVPGMQTVATWTQQVIQAMWDNQHMSTVPDTCYWDNTSKSNFNCLGMFLTFSSSSQGLRYHEQIDVRTENVINGLFPMLVHFAHLYDSTFLRLSRVRVQAAFRAKWGKPVEDRFLADLQYRTSWLQKLYVGTSIGSGAIASAALCASFMLRSEAILKARGHWNEETDPVKVRNVENGRFTNQFLLSAAKNVSEGFLQLHRTYSLLEFQTDYTQESGWGMDMLPVVMTYAPSREVYEAAQALWMLMWRDEASNYNGKLGDTGAPSMRSKKDPVTGNRLGWELSAEIQYALPLFKPFCELADTGGCAPNIAQRDIGPSGAAVKELKVYGPTLMWYSLQAAKVGYAPLQAFKDTILSTRASVATARFQVYPAQTRYNFVTTNYTIGHAGASQSLFGEAISNMVKLTGMPTKQMRDSPEVACNGGLGNLGPFPVPEHLYFSPNMITIASNNLDEPYSRERNILPGGQNPPRLLNNPIHAQYQSFELLTFLATDRPLGVEGGGATWGEAGPLWYDDSSLPVPPLTTELLAPVMVDEILLNGTPLSKANSTCVNIPIFPNPILTIRHQSTSVVVRLLLSEHADHGIQHLAGGVPVNCADAAGKPTWGQYPFSLTWRVDNTSYPVGSGRLVVAHRNAGDRISNRTFHSAWFMAVGHTENNQQREALEAVVRDAVLQSSSRNSTNATINGKRQYEWGNFNWLPWKGYPSPDWHNSDYPPFCEWNVSVAFKGPGGAGNLSVSRTDIYGGDNTGSSKYLDAIQSPLPPADIDDFGGTSMWFTPPIMTTKFSRQFNGTEMHFRPAGDGTLDFDPVSDINYFQPHLPPSSRPTASALAWSLIAESPQNPAISLE